MLPWREQFRKWLKELIPFGRIEDYIQPVDVSDGADKDSVHIYTSSHRYRITAGPAYLGCIAINRKWRPGEDWNRGNDLPDGPFAPGTWDQIVRAIVRYELVKLEPRAEASKVDETPETVKA